MQLNSGSKQIFPKSIIFLLKKVLRIISFQCRNSHSNPLFYRPEIVKLHEKKTLLKIVILSVNLLILTFH